MKTSEIITGKVYANASRTKRRRVEKIRCDMDDETKLVVLYVDENGRHLASLKTFANWAVWLVDDEGATA